MTTEYTYSDELYSDLHKDAYGFRPSGDFHTWWAHQATPDEKQAQWDTMIRAMEESDREYQEHQARSVKKFEENVTKIMNEMGKTRIEVLRWLFMVDEQFFDDPDYFCYCNDLPYGYIKKEEVCQLTTRSAH